MQDAAVLVVVAFFRRIDPDLGCERNRLAGFGHCCNRDRIGVGIRLAADIERLGSGSLCRGLKPVHNFRRHGRDYHRDPAGYFAIHQRGGDARGLGGIGVIGGTGP